MEIPIDASQMADEPALQQPDLNSDSVIAKVMAPAPGQRRERSLINSDSATKLLDTIEARYRSVLMAARVIEMAAGPAEKLPEIEMLTAPTARRTQEPRPCPVGPDHRDSGPVDQKIGPLSGELYAGRRGWANAYYLADHGGRVACVIYPPAGGCESTAGR